MEDTEYLKAYDLFSDAIFRHCFFRISDRELAKDLAQETFVRTWEYISRGNEVQNLRALLYRIANNLIIDEYRKKKMLRLEEMQESGFEPREDGHEKIEARSEALNALRVLHKIEKESRDLIIWRYVDGFGPKEIAEISGTSENVISVRLHRAMKKLKELLTNDE